MNKKQQAQEQWRLAQPEWPNPHNLFQDWFLGWPWGNSFPALRLSILICKMRGSGLYCSGGLLSLPRWYDSFHYSLVNGHTTAGMVSYHYGLLQPGWEEAGDLDHTVAKKLGWEIYLDLGHQNLGKAMESNRKDEEVRNFKILRQRIKKKQALKSNLV